MVVLEDRRSRMNEVPLEGTLTAWNQHQMKKTDEGTDHCKSTFLMSEVSLYP
jgi:hypothetical protein